MDEAYAKVEKLVAQLHDKLYATCDDTSTLEAITQLSGLITHDLKYELDDQIFRLSDSLRVMINMVESGRDPHSFYDKDQLTIAKSLLKKG